jgi:sugar lactone lactonase YvrE
MLMKKYLLIFMAIVLGATMFVLPKTWAEDKPKVSINIEQIFGVMPDDYIGSMQLSDVNTSEEDYLIGNYYPIVCMGFNGDNLFVGDTSYGRIHILSGDLSHRNIFGSLGMGDNKYQLPSDINFDKDGNAYITDLYNCYVTKVDKRGSFVKRFGVEGTENGQFLAPAGVCVDGSGNVYVSDGITARVQKFDSSFNYVTTFGKTTDKLQLVAPGAIRMGSNGDVFVADYKNGVIFEYTTDGKFVKTFVNPPAEKKIRAIGQFDFDKDGNIWIVDRAPGNVNLTLCSSDGSVKKTFKVGDGDAICDGLTVGPDGVYVHVMGIPTSPNGYSPDNPFFFPTIQTLYKLDFSGKVSTTFKSDPAAEGRGGEIMGVAVDSKGYVYSVSRKAVSGDKENSKVHIFKPDGSLSDTITGSDLNIPAGATIKNVTIDSYDNVYFVIAESSVGYVVKMSGSNSTFGKEDIIDPSYIVTDRMDNIYVGDNGKKQVTVFTNQGRKRDEIRVNSVVRAIAVDPYRNIAVASDTSISVVDKKGRDIGTMGGGGRKDGSVYYPTGIVFTDKGGVIVSDTENGRIQIFDRTDTGKFKLAYTSPRAFYCAGGLFWGKDNKLYMTDMLHNVIYKLSIPGYLPPGTGDAGPRPPMPPQPPAPQVIPSDGELSFNPKEIKATAGTVFDCAIDVKYATNIFGVGLKIKFDPKFMKFEKAEAGTFLSSDGNYNIFYINDKEKDKGLVELIGPLRTGSVSGMDGSGTLIKLRFNATNQGETKIEMTDVIVKDPNLDNIQVTTLTGKVTIAPPDSIPPVLNITTPNCAFESMTTISGKTEVGAKVEFDFDGKTNTVQVFNDGSFSIRIVLKAGENKVSVRSSDAAGNVTEKKLTLQLKIRNIVIMWIDKLEYLANSQSAKFTVPPMIIGGSTYVPFRKLGELLNCKIEWNANERKATYIYDDSCTGEKIVLEAWIGKSIGKKNGAVIDFKKTPQIVKGNTMVPLRAISEGLGALVEYEATERRITLTHPKP